MPPLQYFGALWVFCISEVGKYFTAWLYVLQAVLNTGSVLVEIATTCHSVTFSPSKTNDNNPFIPISAEAEFLSLTARRAV